MGIQKKDITVVKIELHGTKNFTSKQRSKFQRALFLFEKIINSYEFQAQVCACDFTENKGMTPFEIFELFMSGKDMFQAEADGDIDIHIEMYYSRKNVVGYTYPSTWYTWINRKFFKKYALNEIAGNLAHEYCHNLGFGHKNKDRKNTVPYKIGRIVRDIGSREN